MFCNQCGTAVPDTARYCQQCGFAIQNARVDAACFPAETPAKVSEPAAARRSISRNAPSWVLPVAGSLALVWAALVVVPFAAGTSDGSWLRWTAAFGNAAGLCAGAFMLFRRDPRALPLSWTIVVLSGLATLLGGLVPIALMMWTGWLVFTLYLEKRPELLVARAVDQHRFDPHPEPKGQAVEPLLAFPSEGPPVSR